MDIKALAYIGIETTQLGAWHQFATEILGMMPATQMFDSDKLFLKMDAYPWRIRVSPGVADRLAFTGWELHDKPAFDQALSELDAGGVAYQRGTTAECAERRVSEFVRFKDPDSNALELFYQMDADSDRLVSPAGVNAFVTGHEGEMGLGHYVLPTANFEASANFYTQLLGLGHTDYMYFKDDAGQGHGLYFLHANNQRHHSLAIFEDPQPPPSACVHLMVEVESLDEVGYFIDRCKANSVAIVSSLGRHTNDRMTSVYVKSPSGFAIEYGFGGVQPDWNDYKPTVTAEPSLWGHEWQASP